ncbi:MIF4G like-domain-containing protein [Lipomyces japonicus]|uniref:MIF4G like-domain-containing protein n=1 Tax=Lipomyces japonicus TaxID=56871 RepID=UPI0034CE0E45
MASEEQALTIAEAPANVEPQASATEEPQAPAQGNKRRRDDDRRQDKRPRHQGSHPSGFSRLRKLLTGLGEPSRFNIVDSLGHVPKVLVEETQETDLLQQILPLVVNIAYEQPHKIFPLSAVLIVANKLEPNVGEQFLKFLSERAQEALDNGKWPELKLLLRFLLALKPIVENFIVLSDFLDSLLVRAVELQKNSTDRNTTAEKIYQFILLNITYLVVLDQSDESKQIAKTLFDKSKEFTYTAIKAEELLSPFVDDQAAYKTQDSIELLQTQLKNLEEQDWNLAIVIDHSSRLPADAKKHDIQTFKIPDELLDKSKSHVPEIFLKFYLNQQVETTPAIDRIESTIFRDLLQDLLDNLEFNRKEVGRQLIFFDNFLRQGLFAPRETSLEKLSQFPEGTSTWKPEDVALEAVLANLFRLPKPLTSPAYYHGILIEACILAPHAIAPVFGRAVRFLYSQLEHLDVEVIYRYTDWFSHHVSNFGYTWKWKEWIDDLSFNDLHPKKVFIQELITKELRLSFPQRVKETLPDEFLYLVPEVEEVPPFKFAENDEPYAEQSRVLLQKVRERAEPEEFTEIFAEIEAKSKELGKEDSSSVARDIYVTALVHLGSRSLSHVETWIDRSLPLLSKVASETETSQRQVISSVLKYWTDQIGTGVQVIKKLLNRQVITPSSVVEWILLDAGVNVLSKGYAWELLGFAIDRAKFNVKDAQSNAEKNGENVVHDLKDGVSKIFTTIVKELSKSIDGEGKNEETLRWQKWWKDGFLRSVLRKYYEDYKHLQEQLKNLGLTDTFILSCIEQTSEL